MLWDHSRNKYISAHQLKELDVATVGWIFRVCALNFGVELFVDPLLDKRGLILSGSVLIFLSMDS